MPERSRRQPNRTWRWPLVGLVLVCVFLAHGALMAAPVAAAPSPQRPTAAGSMVHQPTADFDLAPVHEPAPSHPEECDTLLRGAFLSPGTPPAVGMAGTVEPIPRGKLMPALERATGWALPHWPPGIRRVLFQVFRI